MLVVKPPRWDVVVLFVSMGFLTAVELFGAFYPDGVTITQEIKRWVPIPVRVMVLAWLNWHFLWSDLVRMASGK